MTDKYDLFNKDEKAQDGQEPKKDGDAVKLTEWGVVVDMNGEPHLAGIGHGHPTLKDGGNITSSAVKTVEGNFVFTVSGRKYELVGNPHPEFEGMIREARDIVAQLAEKDQLAALIFSRIFGVN